MLRLRVTAALGLFVSLALSLLHVSLADQLPEFSFGDRFDKADEQGKRIVGANFEHGGDADVKKNFIRLTPDRQSKRGYIWSRTAVGRQKAVFVVDFRIHGQGRRWFGDGIGIWITHEPKYQNGDNHAFLDKYYGIGILLDTFHNVEHRGGHKDVTVQINEGRKTLDDFHDESKIGCDAAFRYHSKSAAFDPVFSMSRIRISIDGPHLKIEVDPQAKGEWHDCYSDFTPFPAEWLNRAYIGITGSTGALADNHDIIKLRTFDHATDQGVFEADAESWNHQYSKEFEKLIEAETCNQACKIGIMNKFLTNFELEIEHWFEDLKESTENMVAKLRDKEMANHKKIAAIRVSKLVEGKIGEQMEGVKSRVAEKIATHVEGEMVVAASSWRKPFFIMIVALGVLLGVAYQKYQKLVKSHLL